MSETNGQQSAGDSTTGRRPIDAVLSAVRTGAEDARKAAEDAIPKIQDAATRASYWAAYGVAFGATFQWHLLMAGGREGIKAGKEAAGQWLERIRRGPKAEAPKALPPRIGPATEETQPGVA